MGADVMLGHDPDCARWIKRFRDTPSSTGAGLAAAAGAGAGGEAPRGRREGGHRRRPA